MELILISNTKLKIMLDESDMRKYQIGSDVDCAEATTRKAIRTLLECAREQIGFNTDGMEIFVQLYTSKRGGCELFVTKSLSESDENEVHERIRSHIATDGISEERIPRRPSRLPEIMKGERETSGSTDNSSYKLPKVREYRNCRIAFSFSSMADLFTVCRILDRSNVRPESRAFADELGNYYLLLSGTGMSAYSRLDRLTFILEYGRRENPDCLMSYINEHGKIICREKAIETLCKF